MDTSSLATSEQAKYETMWQHDDYRTFSPGLFALERLDLAGSFRQHGVRSILDAGCGSGKFMRSILENHATEFSIRGFDIARNCLDPWFTGREEELLTVGCLWGDEGLPRPNDAVVCTDVMEHIPTEMVPRVLENLRAAATKLVFLGIALFPDGFGPKVIGRPLHLTVQSVDWWRRQAMAAGIEEISVRTQNDTDGTPIWLYLLGRPSATDNDPRQKALLHLLDKQKRHPGNADMLDEIAVLQYQIGYYEAAATTAAAAVSARPGDAILHDHLGMFQLAAGRPKEAAAAARQAARLAPRHGGIALNCGNALLAAGNTEAAVAMLKRATSLLPTEPLAWYNLGNALAQTRDREQAIASLTKALAFNPKLSQARRNLALLLCKAGDRNRALSLLSPDIVEDNTELLHLRGVMLLEHVSAADALLPLQKAAAAHAAPVEYQLDLARCLIALQNPKEAEKIACQAVNHAPDNCNAWNLLGLACAEPTKAEAHFRTALKLRPDFTDSVVNLSILLCKQHRAPEVVPLIESVPDHAMNPAVLCALGLAYSEMGKCDKSMRSIQRALDADPADAQANWLHALALLEQGDFLSGWNGYEWRWRTDAKGEERFRHLPAWPSEAPKNGRLLVWSEQGIGDEVMFSGLIQTARQAVDDLVLTCDQRLRSLFARSFPGIEVAAQPKSPSGTPPKISAEWQIPAGSLPARLWERVSPGGIRPWLIPDADKVSKLRSKHRPAGSAPIIGLAWHTTNPRNGSARSIPLSILAAHFRGIQARFLSLQYGDTLGEIASACSNGLNVIHDSDIDCFQDLDSFAALVACVDAIVTIDNSTVHFAGALGRPTWLLVPTPSDWRWGHTATTSTWYPTVRIRRRSFDTNWDGVLTGVASELATFLESP